MQNKEIEEAKEKIKDYIDGWCDSLTDEDGHTKETLDKDSENFIYAIENILQYINQLENKVKELENNSIPKQIVEEKIKELEHTPRREFCYYDDFTASKIYILKQILKE